MTDSSQKPNSSEVTPTSFTKLTEAELGAQQGEAAAGEKTTVERFLDILPAPGHYINQNGAVDRPQGSLFPSVSKMTNATISGSAPQHPPSKRRHEVTAENLSVMGPPPKKPKSALSSDTAASQTGEIPAAATTAKAKSLYSSSKDKQQGVQSSPEERLRSPAAKPLTPSPGPQAAETNGTSVSNDDHVGEPTSDTEEKDQDTNEGAQKTAPRKRGRPKKSDTASKDEVSIPQASGKPKKAEGNSNVETSTPKPRGRPKNIVPLADEEPTTTTSGGKRGRPKKVIEAKEAGPTPNSSAKRGRPKNVIEATEEAAPTPNSSTKRGRPKKITAAPTNDSPAPTSTPVKRGRKSKAADADTTQSSAAKEEAVAAAGKKGRGRPRKSQ